MVRRASPQLDQSVQIYLQFPKGSLDGEKKLDAVFDLEDILIEIVEKTGIGNFDGNEFYDDRVIFFIYGPDADKIVENLYPIVSKIPCLPSSYIIKRYGNYGAREEQSYLK